jgi:outer membrane protein assembly factor BamB
MKFLRCLFFLLLPLSLAAQKGAVPLASQVVELATYIPTATPIKGSRYLLPAQVHSYFYDSAKREIVLVLKKEKEINIGAVAELMVFDMVTGNVKWSLGINTFNVFVTGRYIISSENGNTHCYHRADGKQAWKKTDANIKYIDERTGIVLTDYIRALDINSGKIRWQKYLPLKYNWEDIVRADDSCVIIAAGGLYKINLQTGKGWSSSEITTRDEFEIPAAIGLVPAIEYFPKQTVQEISNRPRCRRTVSSGIVTEGNLIYLATNRRIMALDRETGNLSWQAALPADHSSMSSLYISGDDLLLVNEGQIAGRTGIVKKHGQPYLSAFNKETGTQQYIRETGIEGPVVDIEVTEGRAALLYADALQIHDIKTGQTIYSDIKTVNNHHFIRSAYSYPDAVANQTCCYVYTGGRDARFHSLDGKTSYELLTKDLATVKEYNDVQLLYNGVNSIRKNKEIIIKTPEANRGFVSGGKLYIVDINLLSVVPLERK